MNQNNRGTAVAVHRHITLIIYQPQNNRTVRTIIESHLISSPIPYRTVERRGQSFLHTSFLLFSTKGLRVFRSNRSVKCNTNLVKKNSQAGAAKLHKSTDPLIFTLTAKARCAEAITKIC